MRDPERIDKILDKLKILWKEKPDLRFGQLISNYIHPKDNENLDIFYQEDNVTEQRIDFELQKKEIKKYRIGWISHSYMDVEAESPEEAKGLLEKVTFLPGMMAEINNQYYGIGNYSAGTFCKEINEEKNEK